MINRAYRGRRAPTASRGHDIYQLQIVLRELEPLIWRRLQVPGTLTLDRLHRVLQQVMGWTGAHLHEFVIGGRRYAEPDRKRGPTVGLPERRVRLCDVAPAVNVRFGYRYDLGDDWRHEVLVERILTAGEGGLVSTCLAGERHCPPEDCGGVGGYEEFLAAIRDTGHPRHDELLKWVGGKFDPDSFDLDRVNRALAASKGAGGTTRRA